jgi:hypothetical protein
LRSTRRRHWSVALAAAAAFAALALGQAPSGQEILRQSFIKPGESRPIQLYADNVTTWPAGGKQIFLLTGHVWIGQATLNIRAGQAVVWVDEGGKKESGIYNLQVYGETFGLEDGKTNQSAKIGLVQLGTRGEVRIKSYVNKAVQKEASTDPLIVRAVAAVNAESQAANAARSATVSDTGLSTKLIASPPPVATGVPGPFPLNPIRPIEDPGIQLAQATTPPQPVVTPVPPVGAPSVGPPPPVGPVAPPLHTPSSGLTPVPAGSMDAGPKKFTMRPRTGSEQIYGTNFKLPTGETAYLVNSGVILTVTDAVTNKVLLDIEGDRVVAWMKGSPKDLFDNVQQPQNDAAKSGATKTLEFYLSGHVEIRNQAKAETEIIRADEVYYDVNRNVAIAIRADLEIRQPTTPYPIHFKSEELQQLNPKLFLAKQAEIYSSTLPSDPGLKIQVREAKVEEFDTIKKSIFGVTVIDSKTGQPVQYQQHIFSGEGNVVRFEGVPIFAAPYLTANVERPLGPLDSVNVSYNKIFGAQFFTTWDMYELLGLQRPEGQRWKLFVDGMTARGPALGTQFEAAGGKDLFGITNKYEALLKVYGIWDRGLDILGGNRGQEILVNPFPQTFVPIEHPDLRGRIFGNLNVQELPLGFSVQAQIAALSDRNFLEQYYPTDFQTGPNQETFLYVKQQNNIWAWTVLAEANFQRWMTATDWLPKADGYILGMKLFDCLTYDVRASAGYGQLRPNTVVPNAYQVTEQRDNTGRFDVYQDISLPFTAGAFKIVPYLDLDLTEYTQDLNGESVGRVYGGGGVRASIPFSRLYPDVQSELFNLDGIFHKIVLSGNYFVAHSNVPFSRLPQLDQLNDNTTDQALRDIRPWQPLLNPSNAAFLASPVFNPQIYALRRLVDSAVDTLDSMQVMQLDLRQRWQTKRGFPGNEHVVDWMTLDVQASIYPNAQRDSFGTHFGDIEYDWVWNIGDRTALVSSGWFEPISHGPRVFDIGTYLGRVDRTSFYLGYRQIDPLNSRAVITSITYAFSAKYALTFGSNFDFGNNIQSNTLMISRIGTDVTVSLGLGYNSIVRTFGVQFEIVPNLIPSTSRPPGAGAFGTTGAPLATR